MWLWLGCASPVVVVDTGVPEAGCEVGPAEVSLAQLSGDYGLVDGDPVYVGVPPQGGSPFAPFRLKMSGFDGLQGATLLDLLVADLGGAVLGGVTVQQGFICANAGPDVDHWVGAEAHARFAYQTVEGLVGQEVEVTATITAPDGEVGVSHYRGTMTAMP